ncbi:MAG: MlaD family protein [Luteibaculaceae bacterium]
MKITREVKIGFLALVAILTIYIGLNYLKGLNSFSENTRYFAVYEHIEGLRVGNPVVINGFKVGTISKIEYRSDLGGKLRVDFTVTDKNVVVTEGSKAMLASTDLLGSKAVELVIGKSDVELPPNSELKSEILASIFDNAENIIKPLKDKTEHLIVSVDSLFTTLNEIVDAAFTTDVKKSLSSLRVAFENLESSSITAKNLLERENEKISSITTNVNSLTTSLARNTQNLDKIMENMRNVSDTLAQAELAGMVAETKNAMASLNVMLTSINESNGTIGALIHSDSLHQNFLATTKQLELLLENFREYPNRYTNFSVFGKREGIKLSSKEEKQLKKLLKENQ